MARRKRQRGRNISGILLLDKPLGITSNKALQTVKRLFDANKAGHTGNLDPLATGLLPICFGEATKLSAFLLDADKRYLGRVKLGQRTLTADAEGEVIETRPVDPALDEERVREVLARFSGEIEQIPPMHSAVKHQGQPLYKLAHKGLEVERKPRTVTIFSLELLSFENDCLEIAVHCSKGTYIRTLAEDIGEALGCGAHLAKLHRTQVGSFTEADSFSLDQLQALAEQGMEALDACLLPLEATLTEWPSVELSESMSFYVRQGQAVLVPNAPTRGWVRLISPAKRFIGVGQVLDDGRIGPKRLFNLDI